jgi:hypothetical protein
MREGKFPRPIQLGQHSVGWVEDEINDYLHRRIAERDAVTLEKLNSEPKTDADRGAVARDLVRKVAQSKTDW